MSRNGAGVYTLPSNSFNPAVTSTPIGSAAWNQTAADLATALTYSIASDGQTPTTVRIPFAQGVKLNNGAVGNPALNFTSDLTSGIYLPTSGQVAITAAGVQSLLATATGVSIPGALAVTGAISGPTISAASTSLSQLSASLSSTNSTQALVSTSLGNVSTSLNNVSSSVTANAGVSTSVSQISSSLSTTNSTVALLSSSTSQISSSLSTTNSTQAQISTSLANVSTSLNNVSSSVTANAGVSTSVSQISSSLSTTNSNVTKISTSVANVSTSLASVATALGSAVSGTSSSADLGFLGAPFRGVSAILTFALTDQGNGIGHYEATARAWTIPPHSSVALDAGATILIRNGVTSGVITLTRGAGVSLYISGQTTNQNIALAPGAFGSIFCEGSDTWVYSGTGAS